MKFTHFMFVWFVAFFMGWWSSRELQEKSFSQDSGFMTVSDTELKFIHDGEIIATIISDSPIKLIERKPDD